MTGNSKHINTGDDSMKRRRFIADTAKSSMIVPALLLKGCAAEREYDLIISGGIVYDGTGSPGIEASPVWSSPTACRSKLAVWPLSVPAPA